MRVLHYVWNSCTSESLLTAVLCRILDTAHVALSWHMTYYYLVLNYDNPEGLEELVWCAVHAFGGHLS